HPPSSPLSPSTTLFRSPLPPAPCAAGDLGPVRHRQGPHLHPDSPRVATTARCTSRKQPARESLLVLPRKGKRAGDYRDRAPLPRSEEHTSELQSRVDLV